MGEMDTLADLMLLDVTDFDVILGMDWLVSCHDTLDCHNKMVKFGMPGETAFTFQDDRSKALNNLISLMGARRLLRKGCHGYLAYVKNNKKKVVDLDQVPVVKEFQMFFQKSCPVFHPIRRFSIYVVPRTQPISIPPNRMAATELKELKDQLQDLLDK